MRVLFATAEFTPLARVGGLAEAAAGLVDALRVAGVEVDVVVPDYSTTPLRGETRTSLRVPGWVGPAVARRGRATGAGDVTLVDVPGIARPHPYVDSDGTGWKDNDRRFFGFSAAVAALVAETGPDILHLNDWHTGFTSGLLEAPPPTVLTIHNLGYQGIADPGWLDLVPRHHRAFEWYGGLNPLAGAIRLADRIVAVSPNYAREITTPAGGMGLHDVLSARVDRLIGIRNGINTAVWDPAHDPALAGAYSVDDLEGKLVCRSALIDELGWEGTPEPLVGMVTRLVDQKGVDLALATLPYAATLPMRLVVLGSGERSLTARAQAAAARYPGRFHFTSGYNADFGHRIFAGSDLFAMPSRFEPCGLAQMQAMAYGTIPVVTDVGGLHDTVIDADHDRKNGTGFISSTVDVAGIVDTLHRAVRARRHPARRAAIQRRGMSHDWSWARPAQRHIELYRAIAGG